MDPLEHLPYDILLHILDRLSVSDIRALAQTCRSWHQFLANCDDVWKRLCKRHCDWSSVVSDLHSGVTWKELFQRYYGPAQSKRMWLSGTYAKVCRYTDLPRTETCAMDRDAWGDILDTELSRDTAS